MGILSNAIAQVKNRLDEFLPAHKIEEICRQEGYRFRKRKVNGKLVGGPALTIQLLLLQLLARVALRGLRRVAGVGKTAQAICAARIRLPLSVMFQLVEEAARQFWPQSKQAGQGWKDFRVVLVDGTHFHCPDTPSLRRQYGKPKNQRRTSGSYPAPKLLAVMDLASGMIAKVIDLPWAKQEKTCLMRVLRPLGRGDLVLGDRAFGGYATLAMMRQRELNGCFHLSRQLIVRGGKGRGRAKAKAIRKLGKQDWLVRWDRGVRPSWLSARAWEKLPESIMVRQIAFRLHRPGYRSHWVWIATTLLDAKAYPAGELAELYGKRWQVEVCFRDLKQTLGFARLSARTAAGVRKQMLACVLLYNLIRGVMLAAAKRQKTTADRISFKDAMQWLLYSEAGGALEDLVINPKRKRKTEPRQVKARRNKYSPMRAERSTLQRPAAEVKI